MRMDDHTRVWAEYEDLLERSRVQFAQLRELPLYGRKLWERACPASAPHACALLQCSPAAEQAGNHGAQASTTMRSSCLRRCGHISRVTGAPQTPLRALHQNTTRMPPAATEPPRAEPP